RVAVVPAGLLSAGTRARPAVSWQVPGRAEGGARGRAAEAAGRTGGAVRLLGLAGRAVPPRLGGVCQAPFWRPRAGAEVSGAVHAPGSHQQQPTAGGARRPGDVCLEGLPAWRQAGPADLAGERVPQAFRAARAAARLREGAALRIAGQ